MFRLSRSHQATQYIKSHEILNYNCYEAILHNVVYICKMIYSIILYSFINRLTLLLYKELDYVKITYIEVFLKCIYTVMLD
jgi:hypothetical protein